MANLDRDFLGTTGDQAEPSPHPSRDISPRRADGENGNPNGGEQQHGDGNRSPPLRPDRGQLE
ncbi:hypothetical protein E2562_016007 [Oryza meyeriana var. granulata]|uniref:Uncharacterized protein n=1 Tax=Oryza meyeriana var. granulata TaxID=110450 RepID=A0A6G1EKH3_9ORYZ|nr:hypothetical protein E2562_016007 [Oryza meyeriana var. granulata]